MIRALLGFSVLCSLPGSSSQPLATSVCELDKHPLRFDGHRVRVTGMPVPQIHFLALRDPDCFNSVVMVLPEGPGYPAFAPLMAQGELGWVEVVATAEVVGRRDGDGSGAMLRGIESVTAVDRKPVD